MGEGGVGGGSEWVGRGEREGLGFESGEEVKLERSVSLKKESVFGWFLRTEGNCVL